MRTGRPVLRGVGTAECVSLRGFKVCVLSRRVKGVGVVRERVEWALLCDGSLRRAGMKDRDAAFGPHRRTNGELWLVQS